MPAKRAPAPKTAGQLLDQYFLDARCHLLETAALFDRIDRTPGADAARQDPRYRKLVRALNILREKTPDRAERFLNLFSA